jgi:hypothetical protein
MPPGSGSRPASFSARRSQSLAISTFTGLAGLLGAGKKSASPTSSRSRRNRSSSARTSGVTGLSQSRPTLKNFGATPAYNYILSVNVRVVTVPPDGSVPDVPELTPSEQSRGPLPPGAPHTVRPRLPKLAGELGEIESGKKLLYVYGTIVYRDAFSKKRTTKFCYAWGGVYGSGVGNMAFADKGNKAD